MLGAVCTAELDEPPEIGRKQMACAWDLTIEMEACSYRQGGPASRVLSKEVDHRAGEMERKQAEAVRTIEPC
jgi:hypothetical protein